jgi:hypothetical protein
MNGNIELGGLIVPSPTPTIEQYLLFPLRARTEFPKSKATADCSGEVEAYDGHRYYVKGDCNGRPTRASEWLCKHLSEAIGIAAPPTAIIELSNGELVFGSRRIAGVADDIITQNYLASKTPGHDGESQLRTILSSIYAFDLFVNNDDRHLGNYLTVEDNGVRRPFAFDYSRALFRRWPWMGFPTADQNTRIYGKVLRSAHGFHLQAVEAILEKLNCLAPTVVQGFLSQMPAEWLAPPLRNEFISFWSGAERHVRIHALRKGLIDGTLL